MLGSFAWKITEMTKDKVIVTQTNLEGARPVWWKGQTQSRAYKTALEFGGIFERLTDAYHSDLEDIVFGGGRLYRELRNIKLDDNAVYNAMDFVVRQLKSSGILPDHKRILIEHFSDEAGENRVMIHSIFGRNINAGLSLLLKEEAERLTGMSVSCFYDDDGILISPYGENRELPDGMLQNIDPNGVYDYLNAVLPQTTMFNILFRHNMARALMAGVRSGKRQPLWVQRLRSAEMLSDAIVFKEHPLVEETKRECLEDNWDIPGICKLLSEIRSGNIQIKEVHSLIPSPMSLALRRQTEAEMTYDYNPLSSRTSREIGKSRAEYHRSMARAGSIDGAGNEAYVEISPAKEQLEMLLERRSIPQNSEQVHSMLMTEGDFSAGEVDIPVVWLSELARTERALYIEPGLWICKEQEELYKEALESFEIHALKRVARRLMRYRGAQTPETLSERYCLDEGLTAAVLDELICDGEAIEENGLYYHHEIFKRAQRETISMRRKAVVTHDAGRYQALLCKRLRISGTPKEQLTHGINSLEGVRLSPSLWESVVLPARTTGYKPGILDTLLTEGDFFWKLQKDNECGERGKILLSFHRSENIDWEAPFEYEIPNAAEIQERKQPQTAVKYLSQNLNVADCQAEGFTEEERKIIGILKQRGASFAQSFSNVCETSPLPILFSLAEKSVVKADSFMPVRQYLDADKIEKYPVKQRAKVRVKVLTGGRWELVRPLVWRSLEEELDKAFDKMVLLCKETAAEAGLSWQAAMEVLRIREYTGQVRRGYFIKGLSGAQFIKDSDYQRVILEMEQPGKEVIWLNAVDPLQQWGKSLKFSLLSGGAEENLFFTCVNSTAVALYEGKPAAVFERHGGTLRIFQNDIMEEALKAFVRDFQLKRIFPEQKNIKLKSYPKEAGQALEEAGFSRQVMDYVLWN